jgi:hypothetical protein
MLGKFLFGIEVASGIIKKSMGKPCRVGGW